jgi:hypothetical protein
MARCKSDTLAAGIAEAVTIDDSWPGGVSISRLIEGPVATIWYRLDGVDPTVGGEDCFPCLDTVHIPHPADGETGLPKSEKVEVRLISSAAVQYVVEGNPVWKRVTA